MDKTISWEPRGFLEKEHWTAHWLVRWSVPLSDIQSLFHTLFKNVDGYHYQSTSTHEDTFMAYWALCIGKNLLTSELHFIIRISLPLILIPFQRLTIQKRVAMKLYIHFRPNVPFVDFVSCKFTGSCFRLFFLLFFYFQMRPRISITGSDRSSVGPSVVGPSVRPSVGWLVTLSSKTRLINIFEQIIARGGLLGSLDASLHLYKTVYPSIGLSVH